MLRLVGTDQLIDEITDNIQVSDVEDNNDL